MECGFSADVKTFRSLQMNWIWNKSETIKVTGKCFSKTLASIKITQYKFVLTLTKLWIEMTTVTSVVMKAQPIPPIIWPSTIIWRSDLMRAFHYFFFKDVITHTLCKKKRIGRRQIKVSWVSLLLEGRGEILGIPFFFRLQKMEHWKKKSEESSTESVHINKITTHKSHSGTRCDLCSKLNNREGKLVLM